MKADEDTSCVRNVYIIDPSGIIRTILSYPKEIGRSIPEILRIILALQTSDNNNIVTPANWEKGMPTIVKSPNTYEDLKERILDSDKYNVFNWYLCFKKESEE